MSSPSSTSPGTRRDWLLLFVALEGAPDGLDPVRIQHGMFLFSREVRIPLVVPYTFEPYDYGPMSAAIYDDLDRLVRDVLVVAGPVDGKRWSRYRATDEGFEAASRTMAAAENGGHPAAVQTLHRIKVQVASFPFDRLLDVIEERYPEYAVNSVFRRVS